jgi:hypothetical protein
VSAVAGIYVLVAYTVVVSVPYRTFQNVACTLAFPPFLLASLQLTCDCFLPAFLLLLALLLLLAGLRIRIRTQPGQWIRIRIQEGKNEPQK